MSHFTVLVVGENPEQQLAPFQENNMGDCPKEYLQFFDVTDENFAEWQSETCDRLVLPSGDLVSPYKDEYANKNLQRIEVPKSQAFPSFQQYMEDYCGYKVNAEGRYGYWENPNRKWDWYQLGGRWSNMFLLKDGSRSDQARKKDIDFAVMLENNKRNAETAYKKYQLELSLGNNPHPYFKYDIENVGTRDEPELESLEAYVERKTTIATFAVVYNGKWHEQGEMGWWGVVFDEKDTGTWDREFNALLESLPDETLLSNYDCHI